MATQEIIKPKHEQGLEQISQGLETIKRELETNPQKRRDVETLSALLELIHKKEWSDEEKLEQAFGKAIEVAPDEFIPDELVTIAEHVLSPEPFDLSVDEINEVASGSVAGLNLRDGDSDIVFFVGEGLYINGVLPKVGWWLDIAEYLAQGDTTTDALIPKFEEQMRKVQALFADVLSAYPGALPINPHYTLEEVSDCSASIELIRRYAKFTRYICGFAQEVWPDVDFSKLRAQS